MTIKIERMNLDEAGGDPAKIAAAVLAQIPELALPVPIEEIAYGADIREIQRLDLTGYEGGLISWDDKFEGTVLVNRGSRRERQRYTIGHELGHFLNPWHEPPNEEGFRCTIKDMARSEADSGDRAARMEVEANVFAAELLFPRRLFLSDLRRRAGLDLEHVLELATRYDMSKEATARRYVALQDEPCAVVFSHNGLIRYWRKGKDFPFIEARAGQAFPTGAFAAHHEGPRGMVSDWVEVDAGIWLDDPQSRMVCEQTLPQSSGYRITLLSLADDELDEERDEREELMKSWRARF
jgi:Zn-dependent peptidase ImmA (M78 family)